MREDIRKFAELMSGVMDSKEGECRTPASWTEAMGQIQLQLRKFEQVPFPDREQTRRILIHIANWAAIAERLLSTQE